MSKNVEQKSEVVTQPSYYEVLMTLTTKSSQIRYLDSQGLKKGEIAKILTSIHYPDGSKKVLFQHVRNVLITPIKGQTK